MKSGVVGPSRNNECCECECRRDQWWDVSNLLCWPHNIFESSPWTTCPRNGMSLPRHWPKCKHQTSSPRDAHIHAHHNQTSQHHVVNAVEVPMTTVFLGHNPFIPCSVSKEPAVWQCAVQSGAVMCPGVNAGVSNGRFERS